MKYKDVFAWLKSLTKLMAGHANSYNFPSKTGF